MKSGVCPVMLEYIDRGLVDMAPQMVKREVEGRIEIELVMLYGFKPKRKRDPFVIFSYCPGCGGEQKDRVGLECKP